MKNSAKIRPWFRKHDDWWYVTRRINGERVQTKLAKGKENEAEAYQRYFELMAASGAVEVDPAVSFNELCHLFIAWSKQHNDSRTTAWYWSFLADFDDRHDGPVSQLQKRHVEAWLRSHSKWGQSTQRQAITCVKRVLNWGYDQGYIAEIPRGIRGLKRPRMEHRDVVVDPDQHEQLMDATDAPFRQFLFAMRETGARPGEIRMVTAENVDLDRGVWILEEHKTRKKTGKPRIIYLTPAMVELTGKLMGQNSDGPLFRNSNGDPWTANAVRCRMRRLRTKLNLAPGTVAYSYRHTYTTDGLTRGVPIADMAELLGHSDTKMISEHYAHLNQRVDHMRDAANKARGS